MIYNNNDIEVTINNTGLLINSASLNIAANISPIQAIGYNSFIDYQVNGGYTAQITLNYVPEISNEPNRSIYNSIKNNPASFNNQNFQIAYAGITGDYYLTNYSFSVNQLNEAQASATYICYHQLSGDYNATNHVSFDSQNLSGIAHSWSTFAEKQNDDDVNVVSFNCNFSANLKPFYKIGSPYPHQVMYLGSNETFNVVRDVYSPLNYSGGDVQHFYNGLYKFRCEAISGLFPTNQVEDFSFIIDGGRVTNQSLNHTIDSKPLIQTSISKQYN